jgi:dolichol-phosphate mannosyltransferase
VNSVGQIEEPDRSMESGRVVESVSVVVPMLNEADTVRLFYDRLKSALEGVRWELVAVDDGSTDATPLLTRELAAEDERVKIVRLSRNFGHQAALTAGLDHAAGDVIVTIDADLQDPPELVPQMLELWRGGADVVHAVRRARHGERWWRIALIRGFYRVFGRMAAAQSVGNSGDFRLFDRAALNALGSMRERNRFLRGMAVWVGFEQLTLEYDRDPRYAGATKYPLGRLVGLAADGLISFSYVPLRVAAVIGMIVSAGALIAIPVVVALKIAGEYVAGIASVTIVLLLLGGIQLLTLGVIGEYLGRAYTETKQRPIYVVRERVNIDDRLPPPE